MTRRCLGAYPGRQDERLNAMARMRAALCWCACVYWCVCALSCDDTKIPANAASDTRQGADSGTGMKYRAVRANMYINGGRESESEREWEREAHNEAEIINELNRAIYT